MSVPTSYAKAFLVGIVKRVLRLPARGGATIWLLVRRDFRGDDGAWRAKWTSVSVDVEERYAAAVQARLADGTLAYVEGHVIADPLDEGSARVVCTGIRVLSRTERVAGARKVRRHEHEFDRDHF